MKKICINFEKFSDAVLTLQFPWPKRTSRETDRPSHEKKQFREFPTAVKGTLCTRLIYLRLKNTDFWATHGLWQFIRLNLDVL